MATMMERPAAAAKKKKSKGKRRAVVDEMDSVSSGDEDDSTGERSPGGLAGSEAAVFGGDAEAADRIM